VVVDHVEDHLEVRGVQRLHHRLELAHRVGGAEALVGSEEADGVVAPVVGEPAVHQRAVVDEGMQRQQLQRRDAQGLQVVQHLRRAKPRELSLVLGRHVGMQARVAAHVHLVDHALVAGLVGMDVALPVERGIDHLALGHAGRVLALVEERSSFLWPMV
jgi:hypothetical protein